MSNDTTVERVDTKIHQKNVIMWSHPVTGECLLFSNTATSLALAMYSGIENKVEGMDKEAFLKFLSGLDFSNTLKRGAKTELSEEELVKSLDSLFK